MILETNEKVKDCLSENKYMVNSISYNHISLYIDYYDLYSTLMTLVYKGHDRIVINSSLSFFLHLRNYILFSNDKKFDKKLVSEFFDKSLCRFMLLLKRSGQRIYLYKCSLEIKEFCEYYNFNYIEIKTDKELESLVKGIV